MDLDSIKRLETAEELESAAAEVSLMQSLCKARLRSLVPKVQPPELEDHPEWLIKEFNRAYKKYLESEGLYELPKRAQAAMGEAELLIRAVIHRFRTYPSKFLAPTSCELEVDVDGESVWVHWDRVMSWNVSASGLPWPGVEVRAYIRSNEAFRSNVRKRFSLADSVVEYTVEGLG